MPKYDFNKVTLKSHFSMGVLLLICGIFSGNLFLKTPLEGFFCNLDSITKINDFKPNSPAKKKNDI